MRRALGVLGIAASLATGACSLFLLDGLTSDEPPLAPDASAEADADSTAEAAPESGTSDASDVDTGLPNLLPNPSFENPGVGCGEPWREGGYNSTQTAVASPVRTGMRSCRVCKLGPDQGDEFTLDPLPAGYIPVVAGQTFETEAWVRAAPGVSLSVYVYFRVYSQSNEVFIERSEPPVTVGDTEWKRLAFTSTPTASGVGEVFLGTSSTIPADVCFFADDIALRKLP